MNKFCGYYSYGDNLSSMGYFEELHTESFKVYDLIPYEEENLDKQPPQIAKLPLVVKSFKAQVVPKNVEKESIFVINLKHFIESTIIYYEGMKNVYGISKKYSLASTLVDIGDEEFPFDCENDIFLYRRYEEYMFRCLLREKIQYALRISRGKGTSLTGVTLNNVYSRHLMLIGKYTGNKKVISVTDNPRRIVQIQNEDSIFHDLIRQRPLIISCSVQSLFSFLGLRYFFFPILPANYSLGGFKHFHFSIIPPHTCIEFILDKNSAFMHVKAKMTTTSYDNVQYVLADKDTELEEINSQLLGKTFSCPDEDNEYCVVFIERIVTLRYKRGKHANNFRTWVIDCSCQEYKDDKTLVTYLGNPTNGVRRENYCRYVDDLSLFDTNNLILGKIRSVPTKTEEYVVNVADAELDLEEEITEMNLSKKRKKIRPELFNPFEQPKKEVRIQVNQSVVDRQRKLQYFYEAYSKGENGHSGEPLSRLSKYFLGQMNDAFKNEATDIDVKEKLSKALIYYSKVDIMKSFAKDFGYTVKEELQGLKASKDVFIDLFLTSFLVEVESKELNDDYAK